jgi:hypothetical protein
MTYLGRIIALAAGVTLALTFLWMAVAGMKHGKVWYQPSCAPIPFQTRPFAFIGLCVLYVAIGALFALGVVRLGSQLVNR